MDLKKKMHHQIVEMSLTKFQKLVASSKRLCQLMNLQPQSRKIFKRSSVKHTRSWPRICISHIINWLSMKLIIKSDNLQRSHWRSPSHQVRTRKYRWSKNIKKKNNKFKAKIQLNLLNILIEDITRIKRTSQASLFRISAKASPQQHHESQIRRHKLSDQQACQARQRVWVISHYQAQLLVIQRSSSCPCPQFQ